MKLKIRPITNKEYKKVHKFQQTYLDEESFEDFKKRVRSNPDLYLGAFDNGKLVGICYGHPSKKKKNMINLQGIAVNLDKKKDYARKGIGSELIREFEKKVRKRGIKNISLGSAEDPKVENFYLKNRYIPTELVAKGGNHEEFGRLKIRNYNEGKIKQKELHKKHNPKEVIFIFEKKLNLERILGGALFLIGVVFILNSFSGITGFSVAESIGKSVSSVLGLVFVVGGVLVFMSGREKRESNLALEVKKSGAIITDPKRLRKIAKKMGYKGREVNEGYQILGRDGKPLTVIPGHNISTGVYRSVINALATGQSSFRKRTGYSSS